MRASDYRSIARETLTGKWGIAVWVGFIAALLTGTTMGSSIQIAIQNIESLLRTEILRPITKGLLIYSSFASVVTFVIGGVVELGYRSFHLDIYDGHIVSVGDLFRFFTTNFGGGFCLRLLTWIYTALWSFLFIIPGIVKAYGYSMAPYLMAEHPEMGANECLRESQDLMYGKKFELFCLDISFLGWAVLCVFTFGIGNLFLTPYQEAARAAFYRKNFSAAPEA